MINWKNFFKILFLIYAVLVILITQFPISLMFKLNFTNVQCNLIPFEFLFQSINGIRDVFLSGYDVNSYLLSNLQIAFKGFGCNILLFCPLGFLLPMVWANNFTFKRIAVIGALTSLGIESFQLVIMITTFTSWRIFDVDDIIANTIGGVIGFSFYKVIIRLAEKRGVRFLS